jgi:hypothetical protein
MRHFLLLVNINNLVMKSIVKMLVHAMLILCMTILSSCSKEQLLSCDPIIDEWAKENLHYYENAGREELLELSLSEQRAIIIGLSGAKRVQLWNEKLEIIKEEKILIGEELSIYESIINTLQPIHFENSNKTQEFLGFVEQKLEILYDRYAWDEQKEFYFLHTWLTKKEYADAYIFEHLQTKGEFDPSIGGGTNTDAKACECRANRAECFGTQLCEKGGCETELGCGILNMSLCNGLCK